MFYSAQKLLFLGFATLFIIGIYGFELFAQTPEEVKYYADRIKFGDVDVKRTALFELRNFESEAASRIAIPALRDLSEIVRATATHTVVFLPKSEAVRVLSPLLNEKASFVRRETAHALGIVGSSEATAKLLSHLQTDRDLEVRAASAVSLGKIGDVSAVSALNYILIKRPKTKRAFLRRAAAKSIGQIAQRLQNQKATLTTPKSFLPDKHKKISRPKHRSLIEAFPVFRSAITTLLKVMRSQKEANDVRREASFAVGEIGDRVSIDPLKENLRSKDYYLVEISEEALNKVYVSVNYRNSDSISQSVRREK